MGLIESKGNMYTWVTHTWNTVKGECPHGCTYCYMKRWGKQRPVRFDESELKTDLNGKYPFRFNSRNFIFVGSSCDLFADNIPYEWIKKTIDHCQKHLKIKAGTILIATDECKMFNGHNKTLTIGKEYKVVKHPRNSTEFAIIDDDGDRHYFDIIDTPEWYANYFRIK